MIRTAPWLLAPVALLFLACSDGGGDALATGGVGANSGATGPGAGSSGGGIGSGALASTGGTSSIGGTMATGGASTGGMIVEPVGGAGGEEPGAGGTGVGGQAAGGGNSGGGGAGGQEVEAGGTSGSSGGSSGGLAAGGEGAASGGSGGDGCPHGGHVVYQLNGAETWPSDARELITAAMDEATYYYNCYSDLEKQITVNYDEGVPTAEANVDGWLTFRAGRGYMVTATAMHEVGHTLGVGFFPWTELTESGRWVGPRVVELMANLPAEERDSDMYSQRDYITTDSQHFWPYGLNQASEHQSQWSLINHVRIVAAMNEDKRAFLDGEL